MIARRERKKGGVQFYLHALVLEAFVGPRPHGTAWGLPQRTGWLVATAIAQKLNVAKG